MPHCFKFDRQSFVKETQHVRHSTGKHRNVIFLAAETHTEQKISHKKTSKNTGVFKHQTGGFIGKNNIYIRKTIVNASKNHDVTYKNPHETTTPCILSKQHILKIPMPARTVSGPAGYLCVIKTFWLFSYKNTARWQEPFHPGSFPQHSYYLVQLISIFLSATASRPSPVASPVGPHPPRSPNGPNGTLGDWLDAELFSTPVRS